MENNIISIGQRMVMLTHELSPILTGENAEMEIANVIAQELLPELKPPDDIKKALVNMLLVGGSFK